MKHWSRHTIITEENISNQPVMTAKPNKPVDATPKHLPKPVKAKKAPVKKKVAKKVKKVVRKK